MQNKIDTSPQSPAPGCQKGVLFVVSAPSGAGKTSICREILAALPNLHPSISFTTRPIRPGEEDGVDYHFVARDRFEQMVTAGEFAEWAEVHGNCYGTAHAALERARNAGADILLDIDVQGAEQLRASGLDGVFIFILPPDMTELRRRLHFRNTDSEDVIERRMRNAQDEIRQAPGFDYLVVNDDLPRAVETIRAIMAAEAVRTRRVLSVLPREFGL